MRDSVCVYVYVCNTLQNVTQLKKFWRGSCRFSHTYTPRKPHTQMQDLLYKGQIKKKKLQPCLLLRCPRWLRCYQLFKDSRIQKRITTTKLEKYLVDAVSGRAYEVCVCVCAVYVLCVCVWLSANWAKRRGCCRCPGARTHTHPRTHVFVQVWMCVCTIVHTLAAGRQQHQQTDFTWFYFILLFFIICFCYFFDVLLCTCSCSIASSSCCFSFCCFCRWFAS